MNSLSVALVLAFLFAVSPNEGKVYNRCSLAKDLHNRYKFGKSQIPNVLCLIRFGSNYNTSALSEEFLDGSHSHGLFQINDYTWCSHEGDTPSECKTHCEKLRDNQLEDDVRCFRRIYNTRGLKEWDHWMKRCKGQYLMHYLQGCSL